MQDTWSIGDVTLRSRLLLGTARYPSTQVLLDALEASSAEVVTVALRRVGVTEPLTIPHRNPTSSRREVRYAELYTPASRAIVERAYRRELDRFGYDFDEGPTVDG